MKVIRFNIEHHPMYHRPHIIEKFPFNVFEPDLTALLFVLLYPVVHYLQHAVLHCTNHLYCRRLPSSPLYLIG